MASNAYGWRCTLNPNIVLKTVSVCAWTYHLSTSRVIDVSTNYSDPSAWQCWRINRELGALDFTRYCVAAGHGTSQLVANNAYGWQCTSPAAAVDTTAACNLLYHVTTRCPGSPSSPAPTTGNAGTKPAHGPGLSHGPATITASVLSHGPNGPDLCSPRCCVKQGSWIAAPPHHGCSDPR